jgi:hypothetical protein
MVKQAALVTGREIEGIAAIPPRWREPLQIWLSGGNLFGVLILKRRG